MKKTSRKHKQPLREISAEEQLNTPYFATASFSEKELATSSHFDTLKYTAHGTDLESPVGDNSLFSFPSESIDSWLTLPTPLYSQRLKVKRRIRNIKIARAFMLLVVLLLIGAAVLMTGGLNG